MISWLIFKNYLLSRRSGALARVISWHCIVGVGMGVAALIIVLSVMNGFNQAIRSRMLSVEPHLVVMSPGLDHKKFESVVPSIPEIQSWSRFESQDVILRSLDGVFGGGIAKGYDPEMLNSFLKRDELADDELLLGADLARSLGIFEGDLVLLVPPETLLLPKGEMPNLRKYKVAGLISTQVPDIDSKLLFYKRGVTGKKSLSLESGYEIRLKDPGQANQVQAELNRHGVKSQTWMERDTSLFFALKMESLAMALFLSLAVLITSFSIVTVMVLLLNQKRQDLGLFQAMGLSRFDSRLVFFRVGLLLSGCGILGGIVTGVGVSLFLENYPLNLLPDIYTDSTLPAKLTLRIFVYVLVGSALIAAIGSWLPIWRTALKEPAENLRRLRA